jgi:uncharacterized protein (TIGR02996 family)
MNADTLPPAVRGLLQECKENPEDDTPRLVLADWLQENGRDAEVRARGEFIYLQCRLSRMRPDDPEQIELHRRERLLRYEYWERWSWPWRGVASGIEWERGLIHLELRGADWVEAGERLARAWDWVAKVWLAPGDAMRDERVAASPLLANVVSLDLRTTRPDPEGLRTLLSSPHLTSLRILDLRANQLAKGHIDALVEAEVAFELARLDLSFNAFGLRGVRTLARSPFVASLTHLGLGNNALAEASVRHLAESPHLADLAALDLGHNAITDFGAQTLAASAVLSGLRVLDLGWNRIGSEGARSLAESPHLAGLGQLDLRGNRIGLVGKALLRERFGEAVLL